MDSLRISRIFFSYAFLAVATTLAAASVSVGLSGAQRQRTIRGDNKHKLKVLYFDIEGKGEAIRLLCAYAGLGLEDCRINKQEFDRIKSDLPFGQLPILYCTDSTGDTKVLCQSAAIMRYLGKVSGLYPEDPFLAAKVDAIIDEENDLFMGLSVSKYKERFGFGFMSAVETAVVRKSLNDVILPKHLGALEHILKQRVSDKHFVADTKQPTIADFILVPRLKTLQSGQTEGIDVDILRNFPLLKEYMTSFYNLPVIKSYYA